MTPAVPFLRACMVMPYFPLALSLVRTPTEIIANPELTSNVMTDVGVMELAALKNLTYLTIAGTKVTPEAVAELRKALPKCKINE